MKHSQGTLEFKVTKSKQNFFADEPLGIPENGWSERQI